MSLCNLIEYQYTIHYVYLPGFQNLTAPLKNTKNIGMFIIDIYEKEENFR